MTANQQTVSGSYHIDVVMIFDVTGSMSPILNECKSKALELYEQFQEKMEDAGKCVDKLRIKVVQFRDYAYDGDQSYGESRFFTLPDDNAEFRSYLDGLHADGGGDAPESALEALAQAMASEWTTDGEKRRHCIMLFTDAPAVPLHDSRREENPAYPKDVPADISALTACWEGTSQCRYTMPEPDAGRLLLFTPEVEPWISMQRLSRTWPNYINSSAGLRELSLDSALNVLVNSIKVAG